MNETRRKPTTGTRCPTLFDKWHGIFYMPSCTDTVGHAKAYIYPVMDHWGESQSALAKGRFEPPTCRSTVEHANHQTRITTPSRRINYTPGPQGESSLGGVLSATPPPPATCRPSPGGRKCHVFMVSPKDKRFLGFTGNYWCTLHWGRLITFTTLSRFL